MPKFTNGDHQPVVVNHDLPAVQPGESYDFTNEQVDAGLTGVWLPVSSKKAAKPPAVDRDPAAPDNPPVAPDEKE
jgi:hypothetical protein